VRSVAPIAHAFGDLTKFIQLHVVLQPSMSLGRAHVIGDSIESEILEAFPEAEVILHIDPWNDDEPRVPAD
jgi:ferrous-iron efflux pump FieF